ncbi:unnamed protein product, partial [Heterotrigona itama]
QLLSVHDTPGQLIGDFEEERVLAPRAKRISPATPLAEATEQKEEEANPCHLFRVLPFSGSTARINVRERYREQFLTWSPEGPPHEVAGNLYVYLIPSIFKEGRAATVRPVPASGSHLGMAAGEQLSSHRLDLCRAKCTRPI